LAFLGIEFDGTAGAVLKKKGFKVTVLNSCWSQLSQVISALESDTYDVCIVLSSSSRGIQEKDKERFKTAIFNFHRKQMKGLFIWGDNVPLFVEANILLPELCGATLVGNTYGCRILGYGKGSVPGEFDAEHLVFAGVNYLHEGDTICYPEPLGQLKVLATSSNGQPCIACLDREEGKHGRLLVDTGFTKLYSQYWSLAGQSRYIINCIV